MLSSVTSQWGGVLSCQEFWRRLSLGRVLGLYRLESCCLGRRWTWRQVFSTEIARVLRVFSSFFFIFFSSFLGKTTLFSLIFWHFLYFFMVKFNKKNNVEKCRIDLHTSLEVLSHPFVAFPSQSIEIRRFGPFQSLFIFLLLSFIFLGYLIVKVCYALERLLCFLS